MAVYIGGHSLGAARACLYAYARLKRGLPVDGLYVFGCPNPGNHVIGLELASLSIFRSVKNRRDLVTDVPVDMELLNEEYVPARVFEECNAVPPSTDPWGPFRDHHIQLYQSGCRTLPIYPNASLSLVDAVDMVANLYGYDKPKHPRTWLHSEDGRYWGMYLMPNGDKFIVARGSTTELDWLDDFDALQVDVMNARMSRGFWDGVGPIMGLLDQALGE